MNEIRNKDRILEAIDQLRRRKARPDATRICNFLLRRFAVDSKDTRADLQRCVDSSVVIKVEYKGNISYRNAAKSRCTVAPKPPALTIPPLTLESEIPDGNTIKRFASILSNAIAELVVQEPDYLELGVPGSELVRNILSKEVRISRKHLSYLLKREVENGGLVRMENGHYLLGPTSHQINEPSFIIGKSEDGKHFTALLVSDDKPNMMMTSNVVSIPNSISAKVAIPSAALTKVKKKPGPKPKQKGIDETSKNGKPGTVGCRVGVRPKRAKKVYDPSDNYLPRYKKRGRPNELPKSKIERQPQLIKLGAYSPPSRPESRSSGIYGRDNQGGVCSVCHIQGRAGGPDRMVACRECSNKAHVSCLNGEDGLLRMYPDNTWQCPHCKTCVVCFETVDAAPLTVCAICADAYHSSCHVPPIADKVSSKWTCGNCQIFAPPDLSPKEETNESEPKLEVPESPNQTPLTSGRTSPYLPSERSMTPTTYSPQANHNGERHSTSSNMSDSQSMKDFDSEETYDPTIPDASNWTFDEVYKYFAQYFPEEAIVFREQEIDGHSLLLMKRIDVLTSLNLKLGPALKIYRHVLKLQVRRDDPKLYWL